MWGQSKWWCCWRSECRLYGLLNAKLKNGFDLLADLIGVSDQINEMDLVITGEGNFDNQSLFGKLPIRSLN